MLQGRTTFWLFILLLLLSAAAVFERRHLQAGGIGALPSRLVTLDVSRADRLVIETAEATIACEKNGDTWRIVAPINGRANSSKIAFVIETIARMPPKDRITPNQRRTRSLSLDDYGLVVPAAVVTISTQEGHAIIRIGADTPSGDGVFFMETESDNVYIADRMLLDMLPQSAEAFRDPALVPQPDRIVAIDIYQPGKPAISLEKTAGEWMMIRPFAIQADRVGVNALLTSIANAMIDKSVWSAPAEADPKTASQAAATSFGLSPDESTLSASLRFADGTTTRLTFGSTDPDRPDSFYVLSSLDAAVFTVNRAIVDALSMDADFLRERRVFPLEPDAVIAVLFITNDGAFALRLTDDLGAWTISRPSVQPTDQQAAADFIANLVAVKDVEMQPLDGGETPPVHTNASDTVRIEITPLPPLPVLTAYATRVRNDHGVPILYTITLPEKNRRHIIPADQLPENFLQPSWFSVVRDTSILALPAETLRSITRRVSGGEETVLAEADGLWFSAKPLPVVADPDTVTALVRLLGGLEAGGISTLFSPDRSAFGLNPPAVEYIITTKSTENPVVILRVSAPRDDGTVHVRVKGQDAVFTVSPEVAALFSRPLTLNPSSSSTSP